MSSTSQTKLDTPRDLLANEQALRCQLEELARLREERERLLAEVAAAKVEKEKLATATKEAKAEQEKLAAAAEEAKAENQKLRDEAEAIKNEKAALAKEVADLKKQQEAAEQTAVVLLTALLKALNIEFSTGKDLPVADKQRLADALGEVTSMLLSVAQCNGLLKYFLSKKSEATKRLFSKRGTKNETEEELKKQVKDCQKRLKGIEAEEKALNSTMEVHQEGAATAAEAAPNDPAAQAAGKIATHPTPEAPKQEATDDELNKKLTAGRQALNKENLEPFTLLNSGQNGKWTFVCPQCHKDNDWKLVGNKKVILRTIVAQISELFRTRDVEVPVFQCGCGFMHQEFPAGTSVPCLEKQGTMSAALVVQAGTAQTIGIPVNRIETAFLPDKEEQKIGSDTLLRTTHKWASSGPGFLLQMKLLDAVLDREGIAFDETPTDILQQKGQSKKKVKSDSKAGNIVVISSLPGDPRPFAVYSRADGRSVAAIKKVLEKWMPDVVVTDGCTTYDTVLKELQADRNVPEAIKHQVCCVHFRRLCLKAVDIPAMESVMLRPNGAEVSAKGICGKKPEFLILSIIDAFSKIYAHEAELKRLPNEDTQTWHDRILESRKQHAAPLMDAIDQLIEAMTPTCARYEKGRWVAISKTAPVHKAVVYYKNHRDGLRHFLTDPRVPPDSNIVERAIRFYVLYKKAAHFKQSPTYNDSLCVWFSLVQTGRLCGIKNVTRWLTDFTEAYYKHCYDWTLTHQWEQGSRSLHVEAFDTESTETFDFESWLPWNYVANADADDEAEADDDADADANVNTDASPA